jgi:hypothetical protein
MIDVPPIDLQNCINFKKEFHFNKLPLQIFSFFFFQLKYEESLSFEYVSINAKKEC